MKLRAKTMQLVEDFLPHIGCLPESVRDLFVNMCLTGEAASLVTCSRARSLIRRQCDLDKPLPCAAIELLYMVSPIAHRIPLGPTYALKEFKRLMKLHDEH